MKKKQTKLVKKVFAGLVSQGPTTTLEVKNHLIQNHGEYYWTQSNISDMCNEVYNSGKIDFLDFEMDTTGTYRIYFVNEPNTLLTKSNQGNPPEIVQAVNRTTLIEEFLDHKGRFLSVEWVAKDGEDRIANGRPTSKNTTTHGYYMFKTSKGDIKQVDPRTIFSVRKGSVKFVLK